MPEGEGGREIDEGLISAAPLVLRRSTCTPTRLWVGISAEIGRASARRGGVRQQEHDFDPALSAGEPFSGAADEDAGGGSDKDEWNGALGRFHSGRVPFTLPSIPDCTVLSGLAAQECTEQHAGDDPA